MDIKIEQPYSAAEVQQLLAALMAAGLLTEAEAIAEADYFVGLRIDFFGINELLEPFYHKFAHYIAWERKVIDWRGFYTEVTKRLLHHSPLSLLPCRCTYALAIDQIIIQAGSLTASFSFATHPEYLTQVVAAVNSLLRGQGHDLAFHEIHIGSVTVFLLLSAGNYQQLLTQNVVRFVGVQYPEEEAWRRTLREEDFLF